MKITNFKLFNIKTLITVFTAAIVLLLTGTVLAQEPTSSPRHSAGDSEKVQELKEKLATKVAELRESQKKGFYGTIEALTKTSFTLVTAKDEVRVKVSEDTIIKDAKTKKDLAVSDLKNTQTASVLGLFDGDTHQAKVILVEARPSVFFGKIDALDKDEGTITLKTTKNDTVVFDYEKTTTADEYDINEKEIAKSGLSRMSTGDQLYIWANPSEDDGNRWTASKVLRIPQDALKTGEVAGDTETATKVTPRPEASATASASAKPRTSPRATPHTTPRASSTE